MPSAAQVREAASAVQTRGVPTWRQLTATDHFRRWLSALEDPFADAVLEFEPDLGALGEAEVFEPDEAAAARMRELAPEAVERFEAAQSEAFETLVAAVSGVDPAPLLCGVIILTKVERWGTFFEPASAPTDLDLELVASIVAGSVGDVRRPATPDDLMSVMRASQQVRNWAHAVGLAHSVAGPADAAGRVRSELLTRWLAWRGGAYPHHALGVAEALTFGHEHNIKAKLGFGFSDLKMFAEALAHRREQILTPALDMAWATAALATGEDVADLTAASLDFRAHWLMAAMIVLPAALAIPLDGDHNLLPADRRSEEAAIVKALGIEPGGAQPVRSVLVDPPHRTKPIAVLPSPLGPGGEDAGAAMALPVNLAAFSTDLHLLVEALLARTFPKWPTARARAVDEHAVALIQQALPGSQAVTNVYIEGPAGLEEVDGVVVFEDVVIVIEGKGAPLKVAALRGGVDRFVGQLRDLVAEGARQLDRDQRHVMSGAPARFFDASGQCVLELDGSKVRRCYQLMPCLDGLGDVGTNMARLKQLGVLEESAHPWIVGLTDLNVVVDLLTTPAEFIGYLDFRDRWTREPRLAIIDELELLLMFLYQVDLSGTVAKLADGGRAHFAPSQSLLDTWYDGLVGHGPVVERPRIKSTKRFRRFVDEVQRTKPDGWLATTSAALQVPITVATALDHQEKLFVHRAKSAGVSVTGDQEFLYVVVGERHSRPEVSADLLALDGTFVLFLRQQGNRLRLEDVQILQSEEPAADVGA